MTDNARRDNRDKWILFIIIALTILGLFWIAVEAPHQ